MTRSGLAPRLVLAGPRQRHVHVGVFPGAVGVVVVALQALQEVTFLRGASLRGSREKTDEFEWGEMTGFV